MRQSLLIAALCGLFISHLAVAADNPYAKNFVAEKPIMEN